MKSNNPISKTFKKNTSLKKVPNYYYRNVYKYNLKFTVYFICQIILLAEKQKGSENIQLG